MIKPLQDYVLIKESEAEEKTAGGIYIPQKAREMPEQGSIIDSGASEYLKKGDIVIYKKWGGHEVKEKGEKYLLVSEEDILAIVNE